MFELFVECLSFPILYGGEVTVKDMQLSISSFIFSELLVIILFLNLDILFSLIISFNYLSWNFETKPFLDPDPILKYEVFFITKFYIF